MSVETFYLLMFFGIIAVLIGGVAAWLKWLSEQSVPKALIFGCGTVGITFGLLLTTTKFIDDRGAATPRSGSAAAEQFGHGQRDLH